jgi:acetylornithine deacetylase
MLSRRTMLRALVAAPLLKLSPQRTPALDAVDDGRDLALLKRMVQTRSYSGSGEEGALARFMADEMAALGLETRLIEVEPGRFDAVGWLRGTGGGTSLMLNGHLDTNPVGLGWTVDPLEGLVRDGMIYGIGVSNMKGSCAAFLGAARAIATSRTKLRGDVVLAYVVGELQGGIGTLKLIEEGITADTFLVGEPTDLALLTLHAASLTVEVSTLGVTRHLSKMEESVSAIDTMMLVIDRLKKMEFKRSSDPEASSVRRVNVGSMRAGLGREMYDWRPGQVPDFATIRMSVRYGPDRRRRPSSPTSAASSTLSRKKTHGSAPRSKRERRWGFPLPFPFLSTRARGSSARRRGLTRPSSERSRPWVPSLRIAITGATRATSSTLPE